MLPVVLAVLRNSIEGDTVVARSVLLKPRAELAAKCLIRFAVVEVHMYSLRCAPLAARASL